MKRNRHNQPRATTSFEPLERRQLMAAGDLDLSFGNAGTTMSAALGFAPNAIAAQPDGKVVAVGTRNNVFAVARVNANGTLDTTFGNNGQVLTDFGGNQMDTATAVLVQRDGRILVAGRRGNLSEVAFGDHGEFAVARYLYDGRLDTSFDGDGKKTIDFAGWGPSGAHALALQPDGRILVGGWADTATIGRWEYEFAVARLTSRGALDGTFGSGGKTTFGGGGWDKATALAVAPDGKIVVAGTTGSSSSNANPKLTIARLNSNGKLDQKFYEGAKYLSGKTPGVWNWNIPVSVNPTALEVGGDGSVLAAVASGGDFVLTRLSTLGIPDNTFGTNGRLTTDFGANDRPNFARITPEGKILVAGSSSGKFALARYNYNGSIDATFGQAGKVLTSFGNGGGGILTARFTNDGKIMAFGTNSTRNLLAARYISEVPIVSAYDWKPSAAETNGAPKNGSFIVARDRVYSFPTRVFFEVGGNATFGTDYTTTLTMPKPLIARLPGSSSAILPRQAYIDIPAGQSFVEVPINVINDTMLEPVETASFTLASNANYTMTARRSASVTIADNDTARINFQKPSNVLPGGGYVVDLGIAYGDRGDGMTYGWDADNTAHARIQASPGSPDFRYDSFNHMQKDGANRKWEIAVPNGLYQVRLVAGDPKHTDSIFRMNLEGTPALAGTPASPTPDVRWFRSTVNVLVTDGRLTLTNGAGAQNNKIAFIDIQSAPIGASPGPVTGNLPVRLVGPATMSNWTAKPNGLFADKQIDEPLWA